MQIPLAFLVGAPGGGELLLIFVVILLMFGPKRLPEMARNIGKAMEYLRRTSQDFRDQVMRMDEEVPKVIDSVTKDITAAVDQPGQAELPLESGDPAYSADPYQFNEDQNAGESTPGMEEKVSQTQEQQPEKQNATKTDSITASSKKDVPEPEGTGTGPEDGIAG
ncbi:MAG: twin-arginine translocase TatA/TatE family subunit [Kiritimatiellae bacterium]|nr:twin-arginine translocase TatA/TatE family subunit [Kiritimatiellia bacterium]MDD5521021.1 twin-arginine translocase TatA/TatE family subunit [Kiritimatiellia bacterium]